MRRVREILRLHLGKQLGIRETARSCKVSHSTVSSLVAKSNQVRLTWEKVQGLYDSELEAILYPPDADTSSKRPLPEPEWIHRELRKAKNVTLRLLWEEYLSQHPGGLRYSQFCTRYREWRRKLEPAMRQTHVAGEKMFLDFAGETIPVVTPGTGETVQAQLFIAVLGASHYTYVQACRAQDLPSRIHAHCNALDFFGGSPAVWVPVNLKSGATKPITVSHIDLYDNKPTCVNGHLRIPIFGHEKSPRYSYHTRRLRATPRHPSGSSSGSRGGVSRWCTR